MFRKKCPGCHQGVRTNNEESVRFGIMISENYEHREVLNTMTGYAVLRQGQRLKEKIAIYLHRKCLAEHIWLIEKYARQTTGFYNIIVEVNVSGKKIDYPMRPSAGGWIFEPNLGKSLGCHKNLKKLHEFIKKREMAFAEFERNGVRSPAILSSNFDPMISGVTSTSNYKNMRKDAEKDHDEELHRQNDIGKDSNLLINTNIDLAVKTLVKIPA